MRVLEPEPEDRDCDSRGRDRDPQPVEVDETEDQHDSDHVDRHEGEQDALHSQVAPENRQQAQSPAGGQPVALDPIMNRIPSRITSSAATSPA